MLQQTQAERVVGYYRAFLHAFPSPSECARARPGDVVRLWSGLGYNRRALNLHRAAVVIRDEHGGAVPAGERALRALPGVGPYTARAVRSFAFGADVATVDTNVLRVLARGVAGVGVTMGEAQSMADRLLPAGRSWEFNQAMFDLGATVCTAARPSCGLCPLRRQCRWKRREPVGSRPLAGLSLGAHAGPLCRIRPSGPGPSGPCPAPGHRVPDHAGLGLRMAR